MVSLGKPRLVTYRVRQMEQFPCQSLLWAVKNIPAGFHARARSWEETAVTQSPFELCLYRNDPSSWVMEKRGGIFLHTVKSRYVCVYGDRLCYCLTKSILTCHAKKTPDGHLAHFKKKTKPNTRWISAFCLLSHLLSCLLPISRCGHTTLKLQPCSQPIR